MIQKPSAACIDGVRLDRFVPGDLYEVGTSFGGLFLAEGWARPVDDADASLPISLRELNPDCDT
jgi:hypothetical protein